MAVLIDLNCVLSEIGGDEAFLHELLDEFLAIAQRQLATLRQAIADGRAEVVAEEAHAIKGGAANLRALELSAIAATLEDLARAGLLASADDVRSRLEEALDRLGRFAKEWPPATPVVPPGASERSVGEGRGS